MRVPRPEPSDPPGSPPDPPLPWLPAVDQAIAHEFRGGPGSRAGPTARIGGPAREPSGSAAPAAYAFTGAGSLSTLTLLIRFLSTSTTVKRQPSIEMTSPPFGTEPSRSSMKPATVSNSPDSGSGIS